LVETGTGNAIQGNSISASSHWGIELKSNGNQNQAYPMLTSAVSGGGTTTVQGTLTSTANTTFTVEFFANTVCNPSGYGEGQQVLDSQAVATDDTGSVSFVITLSIEVPPGQFITATATDPGNNTSQFSACQPVSGETMPLSAALDGIALSSFQAGQSQEIISPFLNKLAPANAGQTMPPYLTDSSNAVLPTWQKSSAPAQTYDSLRYPASPLCGVSVLVGLATGENLGYNPLPPEALV
jgi:hypothetical protein